VDKVTGKTSDYSTAINAWLDNEPVGVSAWAKKLFKRRVTVDGKEMAGRDVLRQLETVHGVPAKELLDELLIQKKLRDQKSPADSAILSSAKEASRLLRSLNKLKRNYRLHLEYVGVGNDLDRALHKLHNGKSAAWQTGKGRRTRCASAIDRNQFEAR